jgi:hypothetical protein
LTTGVIDAQSSDGGGDADSSAAPDDSWQLAAVEIGGDAYDAGGDDDSAAPSPADTTWEISETAIVDDADAG